MVKHFRVVDLRGGDLDIVIGDAVSPEQAAYKALGLELVRSGPKRALVAKVYWQPIGQALTMVRLYSKVELSG